MPAITEESKRMAYHGKTLTFVALHTLVLQVIIGSHLCLSEFSGNSVEPGQVLPRPVLPQGRLDTFLRNCRGLPLPRGWAAVGPSPWAGGPFFSTFRKSPVLLPTGLNAHIHHCHLLPAAGSQGS